MSFRSTPPRRRRPRYCGGGSARWSFRSTPPRRRRPFLSSFYGSDKKFRSTPPRRRRRVKKGGRARARVFRFTPPRRRRHALQLNRLARPPFSIRASAREATVALRKPGPPPHVSYHHPAPGRTTYG